MSWAAGGCLLPVGVGGYCDGEAFSWLGSLRLGFLGAYLAWDKAGTWPPLAGEAGPGRALCGCGDAVRSGAGQPGPRGWRQHQLLEGPPQLRPGPLRRRREPRTAVRHPAPHGAPPSSASSTTASGAGCRAADGPEIGHLWRVRVVLSLPSRLGPEFPF